MRKNLVLSVLLLMEMLTCLSSLAQGTAFTYQGKLNSGGAPVNGSYDIAFALYDAPQLGSRVGNAVTNSAVPVTNGLFATIVDLGATPWNGQMLWLQLLVRTNGSGLFSVLTPLQPMTAVPYAITASNLSGTLPAAQISGTLGSGALPASPAFSGTVSASAFSGSGAGLYGVNAATVGGQAAANLWQLSGNTAAAGQFIGTVNSQPLELRINNQRAFLLAPYSTNQAPNVVGGSSFNSVSSSVYGATIGGGGGVGYSYQLYYGPSAITNSVSNRVSGVFGTISGGGANLVGASYGFVGGGNDNVASGELGAVVGGFDNLASGQQSFVGGGGAFYRTQTASASFSAICGGADNVANGGSSMVGGGWYNTIGPSGYAAFIGGGYDNSATNEYATIPGGEGNIAGGVASFAAGTDAAALHNGTFVWSDSSAATSFTSTAPNQFLIHASNGVGINTATPDAALTVNGSASKPGGGSWSTFSDVRLKKNIQPLSGALQKLLALHGVTFEYIDPAKINELPGERVGMIAQEVEKVMPDWVETGPNGYKRLTYRGFEALSVEALRELRAEKDEQIRGLQEQLAQRKRVEEDLQAAVAELKRRLPVTVDPSAPAPSEPPGRWTPD